jgi:WD40 repeat protein
MRLQKTHKFEDAHEDSVWATAWVPGGAHFITGSVDENVKFWDATQDEKQEAGHTYTGSPLSRLVSNFRNKRYVYSSIYPCSCHVWSIPGQRGRRKDAQSACSVMFYQTSP